MKFTTRIFLATAAIAGLMQTGLIGQVPAPQPSAPAANPVPDSAAQPQPIPSFFRVSENVCTGGQPSQAAIEDLAKQGIKSVINLRRPGESVDPVAEGERVEKLGLRYFSIPIDVKAITDSQIEEFMRIVSDSENAPMFIHCAAANRVGGLWMIYRVLKDGWTVEKADEEAKSIGLRSAELRQFALDYIAKHQEVKP
jgi:uncharacterized protein (TIGR01244 family)